MDIDKIIQLIDKVSASPITKFEVEEGSLKISIDKTTGAPVIQAPVPMPVPAAPQPLVNVPAPAEESQPDDKEADENAVWITAPLVGVFYAASSPEAEPFIKAGDAVKKGQVVGIVEAMKLMNEIESEVSGVVEEILVENGSAVEFGQPLFKVKA